MIIQSRSAVSKTTHRASPAKITAGDGSHPPLTKPAAEPGVGECLRGYGPLSGFGPYSTRLPIAANSATLGQVLSRVERSSMWAVRPQPADRCAQPRVRGGVLFRESRELPVVRVLPHRRGNWCFRLLDREAGRAVVAGRRPSWRLAR